MPSTPGTTTSTTTPDCPQKYAGLPVKTIETFANGDRLKKPLVTFNRNGNAALRFPGLPPIRLICCRPLPDDQPTYCSVSVHGKQVKVSLTYRVPQQPLPPDGLWNPHAVLGVDVGITDLTATSAGISHSGIKQRQLQDKIKHAIQIRQAMVRKAMLAGLAGYRPVLDENHRQLKTEQGTPRRYLHWIKGKPTKEYRKANQCVSTLLRQRMRQRRAYRHQVAASIVKHCVAHGIQLIALEKLPIPNLTKSGRGTIVNPGHRVAQKRGLNRRILEQGWAELTEFIQATRLATTPSASCRCTPAAPRRLARPAETGTPNPASTSISVAPTATTRQTPTTTRHSTSGTGERTFT